VSEESKNSIIKFDSEGPMDEVILRDNQARCDFFKFFEYDADDLLGAVSTFLVYYILHETS